jgi:hypothetical protein
MPLDANDPHDVANGSLIEIGVQGPQDINRLFVFTGTALVDFALPDADSNLETGEIEIILAKGLVNTDSFRGAATFASQAEIQNDGSYYDDYVMSVIDSITKVTHHDELRLIAHLGVSPHAQIGRLAYQSNVVASIHD